MKKLYAIVLTAVALALPAQAQVNFGLKAGLNLTEMSLGDNAIEKAISNKSGFFVGPTVKFTLPIVGLGVDASALYDQREGRLKDSDEKLKQQTIQIPVNLRYGFGLGDIATIYLFAGPQFGFNVGNNDKKLPVGEWSLKTANISGNAGLGAMFLNHLQVSVNYNFALSKSAEVTVNGVTSKVKNNAWQIALAYYF